MGSTNLQQQTIGNPLFPNVLWSRPEHRSSAGKLAIIGGSSSGFSSVSETFAAAKQSGAGTIRVILPSVLKRTLDKIWTDSEFAPSNRGGSFAASALSEWLNLSLWSDSVIISGDLGKSSETAIVFEHFLNEYPGPLALAKDSLASAISLPSQLLERHGLTLILERPVLGHLLREIRYPMSAPSNQTIYQFAELLHSLSQSYPWAIVTEHEQFFFVAFEGDVSTTPKANLNLLSAGTAAAVWRMQQPSKTFAALTSGIYDLISPNSL